MWIKHCGCLIGVAIGVGSWSSMGMHEHSQEIWKGGSSTKGVHLLGRKF